MMNILGLLFWRKLSALLRKYYKYTIFV